MFGGGPKGGHPQLSGPRSFHGGQEQRNNPESSVWAGRGGGDQVGKSPPEGSTRWGGSQTGRLPDSRLSALNAIASTLVGAGGWVVRFSPLDPRLVIFGCAAKVGIPLDLCLSVLGTLLLGLYTSNHGREPRGGCNGGRRLAVASGHCWRSH